MATTATGTQPPPIPLVKARKKTVRFRFGIGALLIVTTLWGGVLAVWTAVVRPYSEQASAVARLRESQATIRLEAAEGPAWRRRLVQWIAGSEAFSEATALTLRETELPEDFGAMLMALPDLVELNLDRTDFDDQHAQSLGRLAKLETLSLRYAALTDRGMTPIAGLERLRIVYLTGNRISDQGLLSLAQLPSLKTLYARWTDATEEGLASFREQAPDCELHGHALIER